MAFDDPSAAPDNAMPCASGLLIGTVALMTADASTEPEACNVWTPPRRCLPLDRQLSEVEPSVTLWPPARRRN